MPERDAILGFVNELLGVALVRDYGPQGLQVEGASTVTRIVTGVSCSMELFEEAARRRAELVMVHHGLIWDRDPRAVTGVFRQRLAYLLNRNMSLAAYHLPLDAHQELGHSARIAAGLGLADQAPFGAYGNLNLGRRGRFDPALPLGEAVRRIAAVTGHEPRVFPGGPDPVSTVAVCSGGGADMAPEAVAGGVDLFVTGEPREGTQAWCREAGITFVAAGHYDTEKPGVLALGEVVAERFGLPVEFVDVPNPV